MRLKRGRTRDSYKSSFLFVIVSALHSFAPTWVQNVLGIGTTRGFVLLLGGSFLGLLLCRRVALGFARSRTLPVIHRTTRRAVRTQSLFGLTFACDNWCLYSALLEPQWLRHLSHLHLVEVSEDVAQHNHEALVARLPSWTQHFCITSSISSSDTVTNTRHADFSGAGVSASKAILLISLQSVISCIHAASVSSKTTVAIGK